MRMEFGAGWGHGNRLSLLRGSLAAPWEVAFVTSKVQLLKNRTVRPVKNGVSMTPKTSILEQVTGARAEQMEGGRGYIFCILVPTGLQNSDY